MEGCKGLESQVETKAWQKTTRKMIPTKRAATRRLSKTAQVLTRAQDEVCGATRQHKRTLYFMLMQLIVQYCSHEISIKCDNLVELEKCCKMRIWT